MAQHRVSRSVVIDAPTERIFDILADPRRHSEFDGSGTVGEAVRGPERLTLGSRFGMGMRMGGLDYRTGNQVVEFSENRRLAWRHGAWHRWRWTLEPLEDGATRVTETFDYSRLGTWFYILVGFPQRNARGIERTLPRLKHLAEQDG